LCGGAHGETVAANRSAGKSPEGVRFHAHSESPQAKIRAMRLPLLAISLALVSSLARASAQQMIQQLENDLPAASAVVAEKPGDTAALSRVGDLHLFLQQYPQAVAAFEEMIALDPAQDAPHWRLGIAYHFAGQYEKSSRQFAKYHAYDARDRENGVWKFLAD